MRVTSYSKYAHDAVTLLGELIKQERKRRKWSERALAERAGISRTTLQKIENGEMGSSIGNVFEVAAIVGVSLFESDKSPLGYQINRAREINSILPNRIRTRIKEADDDF